MATSAQSPSWQDIISLRLDERDAREQAYDGIIANYQELAKQNRHLRQKNRVLSRAVAAASSSGSQAGGNGPSAHASTSHSAERTSTASRSPSSTVAGPSQTAPPNAAQAAYVATLESQLSSAREELTAAFRAQSQNAQRLLDLSEQLRQKEEMHKSGDHDLRLLKQETERCLRKERDLRDAAFEKDKVIEMLQDELRTLSLELNQVETRNDDLKRDNAQLLERWLDRARNEADRFNEANRFLEDVEKTRAQQRTPTGGAGKGKEL